MGNSPLSEGVEAGNPRWTDISHKAKLSVSERRNWNITHRNIAAHAGRRGLFLYYAAAINKSAIPAYSKQVFDHAAETELTLLAATSQLAELGTPVLLGIDETRPLDGMQGMLEHAKENDIPVYDGIEEACAAAAALLLQPPTL